MAESDQPSESSRSRWLNGIWASVPTPLTATGALDRHGLAANVEHYASDLLLDGVYCNGIMGEGESLTLDERRETAETITSAATDRLNVGVVVTASSLQETICLATHAEQIGAHHVIVAPAPEVDNTLLELRRYVEGVRESCSLPVVIVEPSCGGFGMHTLEPLVAPPTPISAIKVGSSRDDVARLHRMCEGDLVITDPCEVNWLSNLIEFDMTVLYADPEPYLFQNAAFRPIQSYYEAFLKNDNDQAQRISASLSPIRTFYDRMIMKPLRAGHSPVPVLKAWSEFLGLAAGPPRRPHAPLHSDVRNELFRTLTSLWPRPDPSPENVSHSYWGMRDD